MVPFSFLVAAGGPRYVIAVARHLETGKEILTSDLNAVEAKNFLQKLGYTIETKQEKFELTITAESVLSTWTRGRFLVSHWDLTLRCLLICSKDFLTEMSDLQELPCLNVRTISSWFFGLMNSSLVRY